MRIKSGNRGVSQTLVNNLKKAGRSLLILGDRLQIDETGRKKIGIEYYYPSDDPNNVENLFSYGQSGSGKTWGQFNLVGQSFFNERRSWVIFDSKGSYRNNHLPHTAIESELRHFGLAPRGIPSKLIHVIAPEYYINGLTNEEIRRDQITHSYRIPISMASIPILFEITKLRENTAYASMYNISWKKMMARTMNKPTKNDLYGMLNDIITGASNTGIKRWYEQMLDRISAAEDLTLCEERFSPVGKALLHAAYDHRPRWIVVTFKHAESSSDPINLAIYAAILEEIRRVTEIAKDRNFDLRVGLYVDELQYYVSSKDTIAFTQTKEAIYRWGRANRLFRMWSTQRTDLLDTILRDDIVNNYDLNGTYQKVLNFFRVGTPGYCSYMDRQRPNTISLKYPYLVPYIKSAPPMFQIKE